MEQKRGWRAAGIVAGIAAIAGPLMFLSWFDIDALPCFGESTPTAVNPPDFPLLWSGQVHAGHLLVAVEMDNGPTRQCLVDTGATSSSSVANDTLTVGATTIRLWRDKKIVREFQVMGFSPPLTCILGLDVLRAQPVARLDFTNGTLALGTEFSPMHSSTPLLADWPVANVWVEGSQRPMLLDSGATTSVLNPSVFDGLKIVPSGHADATTPKGRRALLEAPVHLSWGGAESHRAVRARLSGVAGIARKSNQPLEGLVGVDLLSQLHVLQFRWTDRVVDVTSASPD